MELKLNIKNWKLRQYRDFMVAAKAGEFDTILESLSLLVDSWEYAGDPKDVNYWLDELDLSQWQQIVNKVNALLTEAFSSKT